MYVENCIWSVGIVYSEERPRTLRELSSWKDSLEPSPRNWQGSTAEVLFLPVFPRTGQIWIVNTGHELGTSVRFGQAHNNESNMVYLVADYREVLAEFWRESYYTWKSHGLCASVARFVVSPVSSAGALRRGA